MKFTTLLAIAAILAIPGTAAANHATNAEEAYKEAHDKMMMDMTKPMSGDADKDFVMMMIPHHQGAIDMAEVELKFGKDEKLRALAETIIAAQKKEIQEMKDWQAAHQ